MIQVKLGHYDQTKARLKGIERAKWYKDKEPLYDKNIDRDTPEHELIQIISVAAEIAVARYFNLHSFEPKNGTFRDEADVGKNVEVRYSKRNDGHLKVRPSDRVSDYAVLVTGTFTHLNLMGWHKVATAQCEAYVIDEMPGCWWVPQSALAPMDQLHMIEEVAYASQNRVQAL